MLHYLDHAATTPVPQAVAQAMVDVLTEGFGNPSSQYALGRKAKAALEEHRKCIAQALGCPPERLFFTSCGTEGDNWAIRAALWHNRRVGRHIIATAVEHSAVLQCLKDLEQQGYSVTYLRPDICNRITAAQVAAALQPDTALVTMMLVNNETGTRYPVEEVASLLRGRETLLHTDAVQGFLEVPFSTKQLGADLITISAHKIGGPKGIGALYVGQRLPHPRPLLFGGGQERGLRSGTEATAQAAGFAKAVELRLAGLEEDWARMTDLRNYAARRLSAIPTLQLVGQPDAPHILSVSLPGYPSQNIVNDLDSKGICISAGSACHQGKASHVLTAMGLLKRIAAGTVRISLGPGTVRADIDALYDALQEHHERRFPML